MSIRCSCGWVGQTWDESQHHMLWSSGSHSIVTSVRALDESIDAAMKRYEEDELQARNTRS